MIKKTLHYIKIAKKYSLIFVLTRTLLKIGFKYLWLRKLDFVNSEEIKKPTKSIEIILDHLKNLKLPYKKFLNKIPNSNYIEIGCGKHLGIGPLVLSLGSKKFIGIDPSLDLDVLNEKKVKEVFFQRINDVLYKYINNSKDFHGLKKEYSNLTENDLEKCSFFKINLSKLKGINKDLDICTSISCFEHILDFQRSCDIIYQICNKKTLHIHIVNFSNHISKDNPFDELYEMPLDHYLKEWNYNINGLRLSDMLLCFKKSGLNFRAIPIEKKRNLL